MGRKDEQIAKSFLHDFDWLRRIDGLFILSQGRLSIASRPDRGNWDLRVVYPYILSESFSDQKTKNAFHCREIIEVDVAFLARWQYHEKRLSIDLFEKLIKSGVGVLKHLQGSRWKQKISLFKARFEFLKELFHTDDYGDFVLQPRGEKEIDKAFLYRQLSFLFGPRKADIALMHFDEKISFGYLWKRLSPHVGTATQKSSIENIIVECGFSTHGYRRKIAKLFASNSPDLGLELRTILKKIVEEKNSKKEDYLSVETITKVRASLLTLASPSLLSHLEGWNLEQVLDYPDKARMLNLLMATSDLKLSGQALVRLANTNLKPYDFRVAADVVDVLSDFETPKALRRYIAMLREHPDLPIRRQSWFTNLFNSNEDWMGNLALAILAPREEHDASSLFSISSIILRDQIPEVEEGIRQWDAPTLKSRPEGWESVANSLGITNSKVDAYLYYRDLLGEGLSFSKPILEPLRIEKVEAKQLAYLKKNLEDADDKRKIQATIDRLKDPTSKSIRKENAEANALKTFNRSFEFMREKSFPIVLSSIAKLVLEKRFHFKIETPISPDFLNTFHLLSAEEIDMKLLQRFYRSVVYGNEISGWKENKSYLEKANFKTDIWREGFDIDVLDCRIHTESNPLEALKMGSYFDTCLSLEGGMNAFSALVNVCDVNKHVVYARTKEGRVVGRQLIAISEDEELLGYHTYMQSDWRPKLAEKFHEAVSDFATACNLKMGDQGAPLTLTSDEWYNDGVRSWTESLIYEDEFYWEDRYVEASLTGDKVKLEEVVAKSDERLWRQLAATELRSDFGFQSNLFEKVSIYELNGYLHTPTAPIEEIADDLISYRGQLRSDWDSNLVMIDLSFSKLPTRKLVKVLEKYWLLCEALPVDCIRGRHENCLRKFELAWVNVFLAIAVQGRDISDLEKLLSHPSSSLRKIGLEVFSHFGATSNALKKLRQLLKHSEVLEEQEKIVKSLTLCSDARDHLVLKRLFGETPSSSVFAFALVKAGFTKEVQEHWRPDLDELSDETVALGRIFGYLPVFAELKKSIEKSEDPELLCEKWIQLGLPLQSLDAPSKAIKRLADDVVALKKSGHYLDSGKYRLRFGPGDTISYLTNLSDDREMRTRRSALFSLLQRDAFLDLAAFLSRTVDVTWSEVKKSTCKLSNQSRNYLSPVENLNVNSNLVYVRAFLTKDVAELSGLHELRDYLASENTDGLLTLLECVRLRAPAKIFDTFLEETVLMVDPKRAGWNASKIRSFSSRVREAIEKRGTEIRQKKDSAEAT